MARILALRDARLLEREKDVQASVMRFYEAFDCQVIRFSEGRRTHVTPGWPDLAVFCPRKRTHWVFEVKAKGGKQSDRQFMMQALAESCGLAYIIGGVQEAQDHLISIGLLA